MKINNILKTTTLALTLSAAPLLLSNAYAQTTSKPDRFERTISPSGSTDSQVLKNAPNPQVVINGEKKSAVFVVDLSKNILYQYDKSGNATEAFLVASGRKGFETSKGVRIVTHIEKYPYINAPKGTKRRKQPKAYGPNIICLDIVNPKTGERSLTGEFIHGNNDKSSLGKYASLGCIRMDNEVIKELSKQVKRGDIVIIQ